MPAERMGTEITRNYNELLSGILMLLEQGRQQHQDARKQFIIVTRDFCSHAFGWHHLSKYSIGTPLPIASFFTGFASSRITRTKYPP